MKVDHVVLTIDSYRRKIMVFIRLQLHFIFTGMFVLPLGNAMDIQWTRMAGQWPVEASPLVGNFSSATVMKSLC